MSRRKTRQPPRSLGAIFRAPLVLAVLSCIGLVAALLGDDLWDAASWACLGFSLVPIAWFAVLRRKAG